MKVQIIKSIILAGKAFIKDQMHELAPKLAKELIAREHAIEHKEPDVAEPKTEDPKGKADGKADGKPDGKTE